MGTRVIVEVEALLAFDELTLTDAQGVVKGGNATLAPGAPEFWATPHPDDAAEARRVWRAMLEAAPLPIKCCLRLRHTDGGWRWVEASLKNLLSEPTIAHVAINWRDVSLAKQGENANDLVLRLGKDGVHRQVSPTSQPLLGRPPEELQGTDHFALVHPDDLASVRTSHAGAGERPTAVPTYRVRRRDHSWVWLESSVRRLPSDEVLVVARDVTHKRMSEEVFLQAQKMDAVGRLAGGVAHDFNNLLSVITSAATLMQDELPPGGNPAAMTEEIKIACRRAAELTRQLLAFSRRQMLVPEPVSVNDVVQTALDEVKPLLAPTVKVVTHLDPAVAIIQADPQQLERVLANLLINASEALPKGGTITISTSNLTVLPGDLDATVDASVGEYVRLEVRDDGLGMNAVTRAHLFEPFFTTKPRGKGVGLGLATTYGIVRQSNGHIRVRSEEGEGASFALLFPTAAPAQPAPAAAAVAKKDPAPAPSGTETILLVEDDSAVRRVAAALLTKKGYRVIQADGGKEALAFSDADLASVNLLLTDVMMPGMTGPEIATALQARRSGLRVLFMSGYNNESVQNILHKPFTLDTLTRRVREMLDAPPPA